MNFRGSWFCMKPKKGTRKQQKTTHTRLQGTSTFKKWSEQIANFWLETLMVILIEFFSIKKLNQCIELQQHLFVWPFFLLPWIKSDIVSHNIFVWKVVVELYWTFDDVLQPKPVQSWFNNPKKICLERVIWFQKLEFALLTKI